uniref:TIMP metallopeptidase inhibitor 2b n=1 Tax=Astyanax mexicanus TaxID=7994 RepID=A0A8B9H1G5_ASTMX
EVVGIFYFFCHCVDLLTQKTERGHGAVLYVGERPFKTIRAKVIGQKEVVAGNDNYGNPIRKIQYDIKQMKMFKGPQQEIKAIFTAPISPVCGVSLEREKEYLITGTVTPPDTIVRCASVPCAVNDPVECLWTDWITESTVAGPQTQHYTCIKRNDNSCAWYRGAAPPKTDFMDIEDP